LPAGCQDVLHLLRLLIDRLVPREATLLTERGHGLNQRINSSVKKRFPFIILARPEGRALLYA